VREDATSDTLILLAWGNKRHHTLPEKLFGVDTAEKRVTQLRKSAPMGDRHTCNTVMLHDKVLPNKPDAIPLVHLEV
jgi:hypothetical protein